MKSSSLIEKNSFNAVSVCLFESMFWCSQLYGFYQDGHQHIYFTLKKSSLATAIMVKNMIMSSSHSIPGKSFTAFLENMAKEYLYLTLLFAYQQLLFCHILGRRTCMYGFLFNFQCCFRLLEYFVISDNFYVQLFINITS